MNVVVGLITNSAFSQDPYWSTNGPNDSDVSVGAFLDIATSPSGVIVTGAETFDFKIEVFDPIDNRWLDDLGGGGSAGKTGTVTADLSMNCTHSG